MHLTLHLTTDCNMRCSYCYAPPRHGPVMSSGVGRRALDLGARLNRGSCGIIFFGGEPLLCRDRIAELVAYGESRERRQAGRFHFKITTNGLLLDEPFLEFALRHDILIALSVDGVREAHDRHRRRADGRPTFDVVVERMRRLLEIRPYASILMAVNPDTADRLVESVSFLLDAGCRYLIVSPNYAAAWTEEDLDGLRGQLERLGDLYVRWMRAGRKFYLSPFEVTLSSHINRHCDHRDRCELARRQISVDPAGYLYPCVQFTRAGRESEWCIGDVEAGIDEAARDALYRRSSREKTMCRECAIKDRCNNTCGCLNWQTTGTINEVSPVLCRYEQMLMPIADKIGRKLYRRRDPGFLHKHYNAAYPVLSLLEENL